MKQRSTELSLYLHIPSVRNKLKDVIALLEVNEISFGVCIESWIMNNWFVDFIVKGCCPQDLFSIVQLGWIRRVGGVCLFYRCDLHFENFGSSFWNAIMPFIVVATTYWVIAVYRPPGLKSFIHHYYSFWKRLQFDKMVQLGDFNIALTVNYDEP